MRDGNASLRGMNALQVLRKELHELVKQADEIQRKIAARASAIAALTGTQNSAVRTVRIREPKKRKLSAAARKRISAAMKKRWAERRKVEKR